MAGAGELERWLNQATDPSTPEENWECIQRFCDQVNADAAGPSLAPRLLAHKIQSPQEMEALHALTVLETCVNNCGERFHNEIAKFRFLNELIKVLSPKYYGTWSSEKVKSRVTEVIFSWTVWFPQEVKIRDAYQMLKKQGIVKEDPKLPEDKILPPPSPRPQNSIFDTDEEKSKLLARLLKSNHSEDLQAANRLIKSMIKEEQEKSAKESRRVNTISEVSENVKRMDELLEIYKRQELSKPDQETLQTLFQRCEKLRPLLFRLASETIDDDEALAEILQANDQLAWALGHYRQVVASPDSSGGGGSAPSSAEAPACRPAPRRMKSYTLIDFSELEATSRSPTDPFANVPSTSRHGSTTSTCLLHEELKSLDLSNSPVVQKSPPDFGLAESAVHNGNGEAVSAVHTLGLQESWDDGCSQRNEFQGLDPQFSPLSRTETLSLDLSPVKFPFPDLPDSSSFSSLGYELKPAASLHPASYGASLENLFVPLISITLTGSICPLTVYDRNGFKAMLHFSGDPAPGRPDVLVMVLSMLSTSAQPIKDIEFQAAVPKTMKIKLQPASGSELPAFSPLLPPAVVSQVLLLANPHKDPIRLRYKLAFTQGAQPFREVGELTRFPAAELWGRS
ncbi:ADP-ribosylation factor-binding protein GGA2 isoform X3 [Athene cunicularia]|uniref:ADP-ribosylation factor-binding protein GGA2 isoform X3 n=1 Tax=Athene cunicularia TaxID=194338 RepID=UPI000EF64CC1|nr:ADP-ribosylation factor-binding protein GGA2 isoform X3 [Athene cunicularia]